MRTLLLAAFAALLVACAAPPPPAPPLVTPAVAVVAPRTTPAPAPHQPVVLLDAGHNGGNSAHPAEIRRQVPDGRGGTKDCNTTGTATDAGYPEHAFTFD